MMKRGIAVAMFVGMTVSLAATAADAATRHRHHRHHNDHHHSGHHDCIALDFSKRKEGEAGPRARPPTHRIWLIAKPAALMSLDGQRHRGKARKAEGMGCTGRQIDHPTPDERATINDVHDNRAAVMLVGDLHRGCRTAACGAPQSSPTAACGRRWRSGREKNKRTLSPTSTNQAKHAPKARPGNSGGGDG